MPDPVGIGRDAAHLGEGGLVADAAGVVAGGDEHLGSDVQADAEGVKHLGSGRSGEGLEVLGVNLDLLVQSQPTTRECSERVTHRDRRVGQIAGAVEAGACGDELVIGERLELISQILVGGYQHRL